MAAIAPSDEEIVVVVASQQHPVRQRASSGAARFGVPQITQLCHSKSDRRVCAHSVQRVPQRRDGDGYRIDKGGFGGALGARIELARDIDDVIGDQLADFVAHEMTMPHLRAPV